MNNVHKVSPSTEKSSFENLFRKQKENAIKSEERKNFIAFYFLPIALTAAIKVIHFTPTHSSAPTIHNFALMFVFLLLLSIDIFLFTHSLQSFLLLSPPPHSFALGGDC